MVPGIPGLGGDVAPPAFVQQQQQAAEAARRAAAAAADPFGSAAVGSANPQEVRLVIDEKPVDEREVGRKKTGTLIAIAVTGVVALGAGYAIGALMESKGQERQTLTALAEVRSAVSRLGDVIAQAKTKIDHAVEAGNITVQRGGGDEEGQAPAATHPPQVDEDLITWFQAQPPDAPFTPDVYAGRVGRLRPQLVQKLTVVQLQFNELWRQLRVHTTSTRVADVRAAIESANPQTPQNQELTRLVAVFSRTPQGAMFAQIGTATGPATPQGALPVGGPGITGNATRNVYTGGDIRADSLPNIAFPVSPGQGVVVQMRQAAAFPWQQYRQRVSEMKTLVDELVTTHQQLVDALSGRGH